MARLDDLWRKVESLYSEKLETREDWADWLYPNHVVVVARSAKSIAERKGANVELSQVAALLHDVADIKMKRADPGHEAESLKTARELMQAHGYTTDEISLVVDDAIRYHSCHGDERPKSVEGLVLATADSLAHLQTNFYVHAAWEFGKSGRNLEKLTAWTLEKIEGDLHNKIAFDDIREEARPDYEMIKELFGRAAV
ncbi:MAG TPA: HD domain-containing protein [Patescibacteria group bacterium]|nr:HD domain-containing protein [Patescibacteria group bacterium]